jgi:hypothetical protein
MGCVGADFSEQFEAYRVGHVGNSEDKVMLRAAYLDANDVWTFNVK